MYRCIYSIGSIGSIGSICSIGSTIILQEGGPAAQPPGLPPLV
jgi:hypothetical protein